MLEKNFVKVKFPELRKIMVDHFKENYNSIMEQVYRNVGDHDSIATTRLYGMTMWLDYSNVGVRLTKIYEGFVKELL